MKKPNSKKTQELIGRRNVPLATRTDLKPSATKDIAGAMNAILADVFALYPKTKNFHWQAARISAITTYFSMNMAISFSR